MNYKGIYFGEAKSQKFCEFGVGKINDNENKPLIRNKSNDISNNIHLISEEKKILSRNYNNNIYLNNPNTQKFNFNKSLNISKTRKKSEFINSSKNINCN